MEWMEGKGSNLGHISIKLRANVHFLAVGLGKSCAYWPKKIKRIVSIASCVAFITGIL